MDKYSNEEVEGATTDCLTVLSSSGYSLETRPGSFRSSNNRDCGSANSLRTATDKSPKPVKPGVSDLTGVVIGALALVLCLVLVATPLRGTAAEKDQAFRGGDTQALQFSKDKEIQQIKPKKPVKIKLHRNAKGEYVWDITGDNADDVVKADKRLRKLLNLE